jgi:hypothetical protein
MHLANCRNLTSPTDSFDEANEEEHMTNEFVGVEPWPMLNQPRPLHVMTYPSGEVVREWAA